MTGRSLSALGFLQIYRNKRAQQRKFYAYIFSEQLFGEKNCLKFPLLGSFLVIKLKKPQSRKWSICQSLKILTLILIFKSWNYHTSWFWEENQLMKIDRVVKSGFLGWGGLSDFLDTSTASTFKVIYRC